MNGSRVDFGEGDSGFLNGPEYDCLHTDWYKLFAETKAEIFLADRLLSQMGPHQLRDFLITCRNSLKIGGRLRIGESDWNHGSAAYRAQASEASPLQKFDIQSITKLFSSVGFATRPVEFHDSRGILHELEPSFEKYGNVQGSSRLGPHQHDRTHQSSSLIIDGVKTSDDLGGMNGFEEKIFAVGDSHVRFLSGHDEGGFDRHDKQHTVRLEGYSSKFIGLHLGPGLAFNLNTPNTRNHSREKLEELMRSGALPKGCKIMFSFGEIDCRFHVCRQADRQVAAIEDIVDAITVEYAIFLDWVEAQGFSASVWGIPSVTWLGETADQNNPIFGSYEQRHMAAARFNARMKEICQVRKLPFLSVLETARDASGAARKELFFDVLHLSQRARPLLHSLMPSGALLL